MQRKMGESMKWCYWEAENGVDQSTEAELNKEFSGQLLIIQDTFVPRVIVIPIQNVYSKNRNKTKTFCLIF